MDIVLRSAAQLSRQLLSVLSNSKGPVKGRARNIFLEGCLGIFMSVFQSDNSDLDLCTYKST